MRWTEEQYEEFLKKNNLSMKDAKPVKKRKNKYNNKKTVVDGIEFDSAKEAEYYCQLKILKAAGEIKDFALQQRYELLPTFHKNGTTYRAITKVIK